MTSEYSSPLDIFVAYLVEVLSRFCFANLFRCFRYSDIALNIGCSSSDSRNLSSSDSNSKATLRANFSQSVRSNLQKYCEVISREIEVN